MFLHRAISGRYFTLFLLFLNYLIYIPSASSQVNEIKKESDKNKREHNERQSERQASSSSGGSGGLGFTANKNGITVSDCSSLLGCFDLGLGIMGGFWEHQNNLMANKVNNPRITSMELFPTVAYSFDSNIVALPRARFNWGMLSTDIRYNLMHTIKQGNYETIDWQILLLNIFSRREFYLRIGTGFMYEKYSGLVFNEHSLSTDILLDRRFSGAFEFRFCHDGFTSILPRTEAGVRLNYDFLHKSHSTTSLTLGILYQNYYHTIVLINVQAGLVFMVF